MRLVAIEYTVVNAREKGRFMATMTLSRLRQARYAILGFGCNQAFLFAMLYLGSYNESSQHGFLIDRADLLCVLLVMAATFALMTRERRRRHLMVVAEGLVRCYALPLVGALYLIVALHSLAPGIPWLALAAVEGLAAGVPLALLLCRWGRVLGEASIDQSVPEVFIGSALGAAVCFFVVAIPVEGAYILLYVLPVGSAWALRALGEPDDRDAEPAAADDPTEEAAKLSGRIIAGTVVYGLATGAVEALATSAEGGAASSLSVTFVLFVLYCAAALQLYGGRPLSVGVRAVLPTGPDQEVGPLGGAYRLAILLMVGGFVAVPLLESVNVSGVAVLYAYLFLFTDRDMAALSVVIAQSDRFEEACELIARTAKLSKREAEILPLALRGRTAERIAGEFFISKNTVDTHLRRIYAKCGVHTRQELIDLGERTEAEL